MKVKTTELTGAALNWAVCKAADMFVAYPKKADGKWFKAKHTEGSLTYLHPSTDWSQGGPIIERERINIRPDQASPNFKAFVIIRPTGLAHRHNGPTPLIAAMRCFCASRLGDEVDVPKELA
jgi:hypothetical protein